MVSDFLAEVSSSLRALVYEACTRVKESIEKNDKLLPGSAKRLVSIMEKVNSLNFYNDVQVEKMIADITTSLDSYNTSKDVKSGDNFDFQNYHIQIIEVKENTKILPEGWTGGSNGSVTLKITGK